MCICTFYATADADEEDVILREKGTGESEYDRLGQRVWDGDGDN